MTALLALIAFSASAGERNGLLSHAIPNETLHYDVLYRWGMINKKAGSAVVRLKHDSHAYHAVLTASSEPWADKVFKVRDTLWARMSYPDATPLYYEKRAHEGWDSKLDTVGYDYSRSDSVRARVLRREIRSGRLRKLEAKGMNSSRTTLDVLSSFYFMRYLPFEKYKIGQTVKADLFSGKEKELLTLIYKGKEKLSLDDKTFETYHITFHYTKNGKKSSDDAEAWITTDSRRLPLRLDGQMPVGTVHCILRGY